MGMHCLLAAASAPRPSRALLWLLWVCTALVPASARTLGSVAHTASAFGKAITADNIKQHALVHLGGHHQWVAVHNTNISSIINLHGNVIVYCEFYCFWAASQAFSQNHPALSQDLRHTGGGEFIHCKKLLKVLHHMGRTVTVIPSAATLRKFVQQAVDARKPPVIILAYPVEAVTKREGDRAVLHAPLSEACCLSMEYGGVQNWHNNHGRASLLNASKILSVFPNGHNTHIGLDKPTSCPYTSVARPIDHSYVLVYGKWGVSAHVWGIKPQFNNSGLWDAIVAKHTVVFVRCTKELPPGLSIDAAKWQAWVQDGKVMCLDTLPVPLPWDDLLAHAEFVMGLGWPHISPSPMQALYCQTPLVIPPEQHEYLKSHAGPPHVYLPKTPQDVLDAMQDIARKCKVSYNSELGVRARKVSSCFDKAHVQALEAFDEDATAQKLRSLLAYVEAECAKTV